MAWNTYCGLMKVPRAGPSGTPTPRLPGARRSHAQSHPRARHHGARPGRNERKQMKYRLLAAAALAVPLLASAQVAKDKPAAKGATGPIATVNGVGISRARGEFLLNQQMARGAPDNDQTRAMVREELVNREVLAQDAVRSRLRKTQQEQMQVDLPRHEIIVRAYLRAWPRTNPPPDADRQQQYER